MVREGRERTIVGGSASLFLSRVLAGALSYLGTSAVARTLSNDAWGAFTFVTSVTSIIAFLFDFQVSRMVLVEILERDDDPGEVVGSYMTMRFVFGVAAYAATLGFVVVSGYEVEIVRATLVGGLMLLLAPTWNGLFLFFQSRHWLRSVGTLTAISRLILLLCCLGLAAANVRSLVPYMWPAVVAETFLLVSLVVIASRHLRLRPAVEWGRWMRWSKEAIPITMGYAIGSLYYRLDTVMLSQMDTLRAVGLYGIGYKFSDIMGVLPLALLASVFTLLLQTWQRDTEAFKHTLRSAWVLLLVSAFGVTTLLAIFTRPLIVLLYGDRYEDASNAARLVVAGQGVRFFTVLCVTVLISVSRNVLYAVASVVGLALNVVLNLYLIPRYSFGGAAFATIVTEIVVLAVLITAVRRIPDARVFPWAAAGRALVASAVMLAVALSADLILPWPAAAALAGLAFLATLHAIGVEGPGGLRAVPHLLQPITPDDRVTP